MPVTLGSKPASSEVDGEGSLSSSVSVVLSAVALFAVSDGMVAGAAIAAAGGAANGVAERALAASMPVAFAARRRWPRVHHTPAPKTTANNTTTATTTRPGREWLSASSSVWTRGGLLDFEFSETESG